MRTSVTTQGRLLHLSVDAGTALILCVAPSFHIVSASLSISPLLLVLLASILSCLISPDLSTDSFHCMKSFFVLTNASNIFSHLHSLSPFITSHWGIVYINVGNFEKYSAIQVPMPWILILHVHDAYKPIIMYSVHSAICIAFFYTPIIHRTLN